MAGYGMRDGSAITRAIGDYANYKQRQEQIEYARDQQDYENRINERRLAMDEHRQNARLSMQMDEAEYRNSERQRIADERAAAQKAREGYRDSMMAELNASEQKAFAAIGAGASGQGQGVEVIDDGDDIILGVKKGEGRVDPFTKNPHDQNSPPFRIPKANVGEARQHAARSAEIAEANGATPEETAAYIRAGFTVGDDGKARPASESEFMANLKEQGLLDAMKGKFVDSDVPIDVGNGGESTPTKKDHFKGIVGHGKELYEAGNRGARQMYNTFVRGDWLVSTGISDHVRKTGSYVLFGNQAKVKLAKNDEIKVTPSAKVSTPEGADDLKKTKQTIEENSEAETVPRLSKKTSEVAAVPDIEGKMQVIRDKFEAKRKRAAVVGELYLTGNIDESQMRNYMETGDMRYSMNDIEKQKAEIYSAKASADERVLKAEVSLLKAKIEHTKLVDQSYKDDVEFENAVIDGLTGVSDGVAEWYSASKGLKGQDADGVKGRLATLPVTLIGSNVFSKKEMKRSVFKAMYVEGLRSFLADRGDDMELSAETVLPYMTSALGRYKPIAAQTILRATMNSERPLSEVRKQYSDLLDEKMIELSKQGADWGDKQQEVFDAFFLEQNL